MEGSSSWFIRMQREIKDEERLPSGSIHKLPESVLNGKAEDYKPRIISFGPYHHGEPHLEAMEKHKKRAVVQFFSRSKKTIGECWDELEKVVGDLKLAYALLDPKWQENTEAFLQLMIRDGCFILEFFWLRRLWVREETELHEYAPNDPIFSRHGMIYNETSIYRDMYLLQNQLPLLVLRLLLTAYYGYKDTGDQRFDDLLGVHTRSRFHREWTSSDCHLLAVYRKNLVGKASVGEAPVVSTPAVLYELSERIWSAREMHEAGIRIESSRTRELNGISFHRDRGILRLPAIVVGDLTETLFLNLMASERFQPGIGYEVTGTISFIASIIHGAEDVSFLSSCDIILKDATSTTDEDVAQLFKLLSRDIILDPDSPHLEILANLQSYCKPRYHQWRANIIRTYFRNPWAGISVIASIVLFVLTLGQTLYSIIPYYNRK